MIAWLVRQISIAMLLGALGGGGSAKSQELSDPTAADFGFASVYFLDHAPSPTEPVDPPVSVKDFTVAKVRLLQSPRNLIERDNIDRPLPVDLFKVRVEVVDVLSGNEVAASTQYDVFFGTPESGRRVKYPVTPSERSKEYFVRIYLGQDRIMRLAGSPLSRARYDEWYISMSTYLGWRSSPNSGR